MKKKKRWLLGRMIPKAIGGVSGRGREGGSGSDIAVQQKALKAMLSALLAADEVGVCTRRHSEAAPQ